MNLLVCFKVVPDLEMLLDKDWKADDRQAVDVSFVKSTWNCFDESALEMMLKLSDLSEGFNVLYNLNAFTIGDSRCDNYLKTLYALGYQKAIRVDCSEDIRFVPEKIASVISQYVQEKNSQDVIVMGQQANEGDNGKTPYLTAELLGWPCISQVIMVEPAEEDYLIVTSNTDTGVITQKIHIPCVLAVGNAPNSYIRVPTLKDRMKTSKKEIELWSLEDFQQFFERESEAECNKLTAVFYTRDGLIIEGSTPEEKAANLYYNYLKGRLKNK